MPPPHESQHEESRSTKNSRGSMRPGRGHGTPKTPSYGEYRPKQNSELNYSSYRKKPPTRKAGRTQQKNRSPSKRREDHQILTSPVDSILHDLK